MYQLNLDRLKRQRAKLRSTQLLGLAITTLIGLMSLLIGVLLLWQAYGFNLTTGTIIISAVILFLLLGFIGWHLWAKASQANQQFAKIAVLKQRGKLIKDLPYELLVEPWEIFQVKVKYKTKKGEILQLTGSPNFAGQVRQGDRVDLLIDEDDPSNYWLDFVIEEKPPQL